MRLARSARKSPRELAATIIDALPDSELIDKVEIAGPGFINFTVSSAAFQQSIAGIIESGDTYGRQSKKEQATILLEFVSANPTGPLHVGHGRHAAYGASLGNILEAAGYSVKREYYVNDAGRQMDILGVSVLLRWLELRGEEVPIPDAGYKGEYIRDVAQAVDTSTLPEIGLQSLLDGLPPDGPEGDKEEYIGALIKNAEQVLGTDQFESLRKQSLELIRADIEDDLAQFGVTYDCWFSEASLDDDNRIDDALAVLEERGKLFERDGATWFRATEYGDEKDRVVVRENGKHTYFASDIAYFLNKLERGFETAIYVLGADHHGYVPRLRAAALGLGEDPGTLEIPLVQFAILYRGGKKAQMSTRSGEFVTLRQLRQEVGTDAARFFYIMRSHEQHLDFDLDLAKTQSNDNPVYYIQYAHARVCSMFRKLDELGMVYNDAIGEAALDQLVEEQEYAVLRSLAYYPEIIATAARKRAPHQLAHFLRDLAQDFHSYYNAHHILIEDEDLRDARLNLSLAVKQVLANGLDLLGVSAPETM